MRRWMTALALLSAPAWAQDKGSGETDEKARDEYVWSLDGRIARGERAADAAFVRLREGGLLQMKVGEEWRDGTLDDLARFLKEFSEKQDEELRKSGKSAYEMIMGGRKASRLFVSFDVEATVPWQNVQWLIMVAAEQKYHKFELSDGTRKVLLFLPDDWGANVYPVDPPIEIRVSVHAIARTEKKGMWGDQEVLRPVDVRYKLDSSHDEFATVADAIKDHIRKAHAAIKDIPNSRICGEIRAGNKIPFGRIFDVMEAFEAEGLKDLGFYDPSIPAPAVRKAARLPYPLRNYDREK